MSDTPVRDQGREIRETIVKSGLAGVGITVLAVTLCSQTGLAGMIGTSDASSLGGAGASNDPYSKLPPFPSLLTQNDVSDIRGQLASVAASMEITRAATDDRIEFVHELAERPNALSVSAPRHFAAAMPVSVASPPAPAAVPVQVAARITQTPVAPPTAAPLELRATPASFEIDQAPTGGGASLEPTTLRGSHMDLAVLFFGDED